MWKKSDVVKQGGKRDWIPMKRPRPGSRLLAQENDAKPNRGQASDAESETDNAQQQ
jgi:hypothetical protein